ncbi:hypothetical protein [Campylobacter lari]|uniref:hypothetical protein n=1 Tax=Campylobacter lari TaxID=201 RepID=UPI00215337B7|nr:hypothetical protein [Campylobacter lari]
MNFCPLKMSEVFDAKIKFSGLSFSYNIAYALAGGFTPQLVLFYTPFFRKYCSFFFRIFCASCDYNIAFSAFNV